MAKPAEATLGDIALNQLVSVRTSMFVLYSNHLVLVMVRCACMSNTLSLLHRLVEIGQHSEP